MNVIEKLIEDAPQEVRDMAALHSKSVKRVRHAERQVELWQAELALANQAMRATEADWTAILNRTEGNKLMPDEKQTL